MDDQDHQDQQEQDVPVARDYSDLPPTAAAAAASAKLPASDPIVRIFREIAEDRQSVMSRAAETADKALNAATELNRMTEAQSKLLEEKSRAAIALLDRATKRAAVITAKEVQRQGVRTLKTVDIELQKRLREALREAAALDQRTWVDKFLPPTLAGMAAGVVLFILIGTGWKFYAQQKMDFADNYEAIVLAYGQLPPEQQSYINELLFSRPQQEREK